MDRLLLSGPYAERLRSDPNCIRWKPWCPEGFPLDQWASLLGAGGCDATHQIRDRRGLTLFLRHDAARFTHHQRCRMIAHRVFHDVGEVFTGDLPSGTKTDADHQAEWQGVTIIVKASLPSSGPYRGLAEWYLDQVRELHLPHLGRSGNERIYLTAFTQTDHLKSGLVWGRRAGTIGNRVLSLALRATTATVICNQLPKIVRYACVYRGPQAMLQSNATAIDDAVLSVQEDALERVAHVKKLPEGEIYRRFHAACEDWRVWKMRQRLSPTARFADAA